jgi:hypothetical protein
MVFGIKNHVDFGFATKMQTQRIFFNSHQKMKVMG